MKYVFREIRMQRASFEARKFIEEHKENVLKTDMRCPISVEMNNGDIFLFMSYAVFSNWKLGRRDYKII